MVLSIDAPELLYEGLEEVQSSTVSSTSATAVKEIASSILTCCGRPNYTEQFSAFARKEVKVLPSCLINMYYGKREREVMWGAFHQLRSSQSFKDLWISYIQQTNGHTPSAIFYQHVAHHMITRTTI